MERARLEARLQVVLGPEVTDGSEVDPFVAVLANGIQNTDCIGHVGVDPDRDFKGAE